jgi:lysophospholipase L1-like esterase
MREVVSPLLIVLSVCSAHDVALDPWVNPTLGVPGFPDCVRRHPGLNLTVEEAANDLQCAPRRGPKDAIKIACVGDSITAGVHSSGGDHPYPNQLQLLLDAAHGAEAYTVTNLGACGSTMLQNGDSPFWKRPQYDALTRGTWDIVTIMLGTNDAKDPGSRGPNNWQHDCSGATGISLTNCTFASDYHAFIEVVKGLGTTPGKPPAIYVMVPPPLMQLNSYGMNNTVINSVYPQLVPLIATANPTVVGVVDMYTSMGGSFTWATDEDWPDECTLDGTSTWPACGWYCDQQSCDQCHPNDAGYTHMANVLKSGLGL